jgi:ferredoxin-NADP reductase
MRFRDSSGITPVYAVMKAILKDPEDPTCMSLIFANQTEDDILLREELDELANNNPDRLKVRCHLMQHLKYIHLFLRN